MAARRYSIWSLIRNALAYHEGWARAWRAPEPKPAYDAIIIGGGGHGLATAYYLARDHGIANVAVLEKGWLGGGNTGRNTVTIRSNYLRDPSIRFYEHARRLYEEMSQELNFNVMFSRRGQIDLIQTWAKLRDARRRSLSMALVDAEYEIITPEEVKRRVPLVEIDPTARLPILAATWHPGAGIARHDAVAWGYARQADAAGVDIIQNCEVTGIRRDGGRVTGVETTRGPIAAPRIGVAVAGHAGVVAAMAGLRLPIETVPLQAFVSEPLKPVLDVILNCPALHVYLAQTDKGELIIGGAADGYTSYAQRGGLHVIEQSVATLIELMPRLKRVKMLRQWAGMIDLTYDTSPIISATPVDGLYLNVGWGSGGFKAIPASGEGFAHLLATGRPSPLIQPFGLDRFAQGRLVLETAGASNRE
ncbi:MAG: sarcosine oxidase subunit beta family protein [Alphaproteobacteria bacterium]|nr:sarcosine oxidase subunit beta family protein [Alphaproteobacteria bacterium]